MEDRRFGKSLALLSHWPFNDDSSSCSRRRHHRIFEGVAPKHHAHACMIVGILRPHAGTRESTFMEPQNWIGLTTVWPSQHDPTRGIDGEACDDAGTDNFRIQSSMHIGMIVFGCDRSTSFDIRKYPITLDLR
tara:strand:- start:5144 stop:5542 length:399 start_codon:yes stop_codon:yes gene_type:complete